MHLNESVMRIERSVARLSRARADGRTVLLIETVSPLDGVGTTGRVAVYVGDKERVGDPRLSGLLASFADPLLSLKEIRLLPAGEFEGLWTLADDRSFDWEHAGQVAWSNGA